ncbi:hypothetical protein, unlikely [Trypanosoma congolense IL3000]|uniref:Variant surface glycoprotein n=1 Tax=Trypanosoma congolense (strain IL3000) TaxID=1068625 RepID=F9WG75_TRYCI|nr:hypothetical protein, unlikely [Trypanosoma congolense IL3000]
MVRRIEKVGPDIRSPVGKADQREATLITRSNGIVKEAEKLVENVRDLRRKAGGKRISAKRHLHQVIFGEYGGDETGELGASAETIKKIFSGTTFTESCGGKGDKPAWKSLINGFICLWVHRID